ncbi:glycosyltransferase family 4 protein [Empedobacter stercoris]|uniref:glycosyltransferase family 4 protein n=1 Tax=Empedobacter stercoris TaxID=1628248 RepID=UPI0039EC8B62
MKLAIDATNIRNGGGVTHLKELIKNGNPEEFGINKVVVWSSKKTLDAIPSQPWLVKETHSLLNKNFFYSFLFQILYLSKILEKDKIDLLFVPGGTFLGSFKNIVSMSQNMLPFEKTERKRFPSFSSRLKFSLLKITQSFTFQRSRSVIFLTKYANEYIERSVKLKDSKIISHGINLNFLNPPKKQIHISEYTYSKPFKLLYVSIVNVYKHQWNIAKAVIRLREEGYPITLELVGDKTEESFTKLEEVLVQDIHNIITYRGLIPYEELASIYKNADGFIFGSSCENQPIILLEAMSAGLPIISSNMGPMPEVLGEGQFYFNPLDVDSIYTNLKLFLDHLEQREFNVKTSYQKALNCTWKDCANNTFEHLSKFKRIN